MGQAACRPWSLGRDRILRKTDEFSSVFRFKRTKRGVCLDLFLMPNGLPHARLGLAVPRRVVRLASRRNRLKRLMREMFRLHQDRLPGLDVVARVKAVCPEEQFKSEFLRLLDDSRPAVHVEPTVNPG